MFRTTFAAFAIACSTALSGAPGAAQSLADTFINAYQNSDLLEQNRAVLRAADEDVAQAVASLRPVLNFVAQARGQKQSAGLQRESLTASVNLSAEITLIDFGRGALARQSAEALVMGTRQALLNVEQQVLLDAARAFMDVRSGIETVTLRQTTLRLTQQELNAARERFELGEITRTDVSLAEARLAAARSQLAAAEGDLAIAREEYKFVTGRHPGQLRQPPALPGLPANLQTAQDIARNSHPVIKQAQFEVTAAELNAERAAAARHGSVTADASIGVTTDLLNSGSTRSASAGVRYARPLYQGGAISAQHRQALARRDAARSGLHRSVAQVIQNVAVQWASLDVARARIAASQQQVRAAQSAFDGTREEARLGARTTLDVLNAENDLMDARTALLQSQAGVQVASYGLMAAMGLLTVDHLRLGIPTYDPEAYFNAVRNAPVTSQQGEALDRVLRAIGRE
ncbi:TolC family outer membrane protein [Roseinatronobacter alkalisoli]|uniref:TolC family outer membrane protein n=1 Tax=Roseinatronobacter alkalisoli TaxID=3028235 RepID=A0ABT5TDW8_9RHOB|nr:TolC family outer membrane protein [Roseinatronobacter sp. HJB301]MDD7973320.1 TolC family outer membrane protein [Roseinatronobacter sp. HJB301]